MSYMNQNPFNDDDTLSMALALVQLMTFAIALMMLAYVSVVPQ